MLLTREWASSTIDFSIRSFGYDPLNCVIVWFCGSDTIIYVNDLRRWNRQSFTTTQTRVPLTQQFKEMKYWLLLLLNCKAKQPSAVRLSWLRLPSAIQEPFEIPSKRECKIMKLKPEGPLLGSFSTLILPAGRQFTTSQLLVDVRGYNQHNNIDSRQNEAPSIRIRWDVPSPWDDEANSPEA